MKKPQRIAISPCTWAAWVLIVLQYRRELRPSILRFRVGDIGYATSDTWTAMRPGSFVATMVVYWLTRAMAYAGCVLDASSRTRQLLRGYGFVAEKRSLEYRRRETKPDLQHRHVYSNGRKGGKSSIE